MSMSSVMDNVTDLDFNKFYIFKVVLTEIFLTEKMQMFVNNEKYITLVYLLTFIETL